MFRNMGGKLKVLAQIIWWMGMAASVFGGIRLLMEGMNAPRWVYVFGMGPIENGGLTLMGLGAGVLVLGVLAAWVVSLHVYGLGELIENYTAEAELKIRREMER